jgi:hypothetical protein
VDHADPQLSIGDGVVVEDTAASGKPIVFIYGSRPFAGGMCAGTEEALATMRVGESSHRSGQGPLSQPPWCIFECDRTLWPDPMNRAAVQPNAEKRPPFRD